MVAINTLKAFTAARPGHTSPENVMILKNAWQFIRISVVHASLDNQCDIPKTCLWLHAFYFTVTLEYLRLQSIANILK